MRIAVDIRSLMEGKTTGVEVYLQNLLHNLFRVDQKNEYILFANSWRDISKSLALFPYPNVRLKITRYPNKLFNIMQRFGWLKVEKFTGPIDLFFSPHWRVVSLSSNTRLVITFHDLFFEIMPGFFTWRRRLWHWFMNYRRAANRATAIITVSENTKSDLTRLYRIADNKIFVIYSGITKKENKRVSRRYFLYLGTFEPRKNIEAVLSAYAEYYATSSKKLPLIISGSSGWTTKIIIPEFLRSQILVRQSIDEREKSELYQGAFAFIFPSFYEGFGFPVLESAQIGVPVISSYNSSIAEIGSDFVLFANPFHPRQVAKAMITLESDPRLYEELVKKSLNSAAKFDWEKSARSTLALFEKICA